MTVLEELTAAARAVGERVGPATVRIGRDGRGAGVVVAAGHILTNAHNLRGSETTVTFADGRSETGAVAGLDVDGDLAVVAVETGAAEPVPWATDEVGVGSAVFAVGAGRQGPRVTFGLVSGTERAFRGPRGRRITGSLEHTAPLARGSSGGPVVDAEGRLVGVNTNRLGDGFYLALPADAALRARVEELTAGRSPVRRTLGVGLAPPGVAAKLRRSVGLPEREGLLVRAVEDGSPAARAGVQRGDLIVAAGGRDLAGSADALYEVLDGLDDGATLELFLVRGVEELTLTVTFDEGADSADSPD